MVEFVGILVKEARDEGAANSGQLVDTIAQLTNRVSSLERQVKNSTTDISALLVSAVHARSLASSLVVGVCRNAFEENVYDTLFSRDKFAELFTVFNEKLRRELRRGITETDEQAIFNVVVSETGAQSRS